MFRGACRLSRRRRTPKENALIAAIYLDDSALLGVALELGANPSVTTSFFGDALCAAAKTGRGDSLKLMIDRPIANGKASAAQLFHAKLYVALDEAAEYGQVDILRMLLDQDNGRLVDEGTINSAIRTALLAGHQDVALTVKRYRPGLVTYN